MVVEYRNQKKRLKHNFIALKPPSGGFFFYIYLKKNMGTQQEDFTNTELNVTTSSKDFLLIASKWANFLAILSFIGIGLMVLGGLIVIIIGTTFSSFQTSAAPMGLFGLFYLLLALLYFFPTLYLFNFSQNIQNALTNSNQQNLDLGFENLKSFFKFIGIFAIITISLYILLIVFVVVNAILFAD